MNSFVSFLLRATKPFRCRRRSTKTALIRILNWTGASPRDVFRVYVAANRQVMEDDGSDDDLPVKAIYLLTHILACMIEEYQLMLVLADPGASALAA